MGVARIVSIRLRARATTAGVSTATHAGIAGADIRPTPRPCGCIPECSRRWRYRLGGVQDCDVRDHGNEPARAFQALRHRSIARVAANGDRGGAAGSAAGIPGRNAIAAVARLSDACPPDTADPSPSLVGSQGMASRAMLLLGECTVAVHGRDAQRLADREVTEVVGPQTSGKDRGVKRLPTAMADLMLVEVNSLEGINWSRILVGTRFSS